MGKAPTNPHDPKSAAAGQRAVGIKDIAKALGVSIATVDRALNARSDISPVTRERVLKMAQTLGYRPNLAGRFLKAPRHLKMSIHLPAQIASFFNLVRAGVREAASSFEPGVDLSFLTHPVLGEGEVELFQKALQA